MHRFKLVLLMSSVAVALMGAGVAKSTSGSGERTLRTGTPVIGLAADGSIAAIPTACGPHAFWLYAWTPVRRLVASMARQHDRKCYGASTGEGIWEVGIAGQRLAWVPFAGGNSQESWLITGRVGQPRSTTRLTQTLVHDTGNGIGDWVGNVHGDGSLLVFNTWSVCYWTPDYDIQPCPPGVPPGTLHIYNEKLWRIVGRSKRLLLATKDELTVLSVGAGRILVRRADGSLELRLADGRLSLALPFARGQVLGALLDASELVVLEQASGPHWRVYDPLSGKLKRTLSAPVRAIPADVERGLLVYRTGRVVHVLRLADGRQRAFIAPVVRSPDGRPYTVPVQAQIEPSGLFFSYQVKREGRVRFVPFNELRL
jgi:hypothetical protein